MSHHRQLTPLHDRNTARLYTLFERIVVVGMVSVGGLLALYSAILIMWWLQAELRLH